MHEHDDALIAALVSEQLPSAEATAARSQVLGCPRCRHEMEAQALVRRSLRSLEHPALTDFERSRLRHAIDRQQAAKPWYVRLAPALGAAAVLLIVVGVAGGLLRSQLGGAASTERLRAPVTEVAAEPEAAPTPDDLTAAPAAPQETPLDYGELSLKELRDRVEELAGTPIDTAASEGGTEAVYACIDESVGAVPVATASVEGEPIEIYRHPDGTVVALETSSCQAIVQVP